MLKTFRIMFLAASAMGMFLCHTFQAEGYCGLGPSFGSYDPCNGYCERFWFDAEYLYWKFKDSPQPPPLVVQGPAVSFGSPVLGQPGYVTILGGEKIKNNWRSGGRFTLGYLVDECCQWGVEGSYFFIPRGTKSKTVFSDGSIAGSPFFAIPFFDVVTNSESSVTIARSGLYTGRAHLKVYNNLQGAEFNVVRFFTPCDCECTYSFNVLAGFRWLNFNEHLKFHVESPFANDTIGEVWEFTDKFRAQNNFYGGQIGAAFDYCYCDFFLDVKAKVALGALYQQLSIHGDFLTNNFNDYGNPQHFNEGLFAQPTNIGHHNKTRFAIIPEVSVKLGYQLTDCVRATVGYDFLYVNDVLWAGNEVNRNINPTQSVLLTDNPEATLQGQPSPSAYHHTKSFWVQGVTAGLEFNF